MPNPMSNSLGTKGAPQPCTKQHWEPPGSKQFCGFALRASQVDPCIFGPKWVLNAFRYSRVLSLRVSDPSSRSRVGFWSRPGSPAGLSSLASRPCCLIGRREEDREGELRGLEVTRIGLENDYVEYK